MALQHVTTSRRLPAAPPADLSDDQVYAWQMRAFHEVQAEHFRKLLPLLRAGWRIEPACHHAHYEEDAVEVQRETDGYGWRIESSQAKQPLVRYETLLLDAGEPAYNTLFPDGADACARWLTELETDVGYAEAQTAKTETTTSQEATGCQVACVADSACRGACACNTACNSASTTTGS